MAGIYIHIPFCKQKCTYCDFHFSTTFEEYRQKMIESIANEFVERKDYLENKGINTIYFGGGTPSLLDQNELQIIINAIYQNFDVDEGIEISLEANPDDITDEKLEDWTAVGINRLSIGLQSFKTEDLEWMNRAHTVDEALTCVRKAQEAGISNLTVDLIYGLPNLSLDEWKSHIQQVLDFGVPHISAYCLTVEENTALNNLVNKGKMTVADDDQQSDQFKLLVSLLEENGFDQYEISNFSKAGFESKHNSNYWKGEWYLGVGPSAHSFNGLSRAWNVANNRKYLAAIDKGENHLETEILSSENQFNEYLLTGLRTAYGVDLQKLKKIAPLNNLFTVNCATFINEGWMVSTNNVLILTKEGRLKADYIASELFSVD
ncbi:MAG: radical SAM family heme chaperone HemW [Crocinitomicaceae bacterium]|nr:radical SAM family heme chaperone HemW [Crocinitomicaceae bacterium]MDC0100276.1 radical SAM family heme chaperone HemW [Crocinitomicaceae bacterium]